MESNQGIERKLKEEYRRKKEKNRNCPRVAEGSRKQWYIPELIQECRDGVEHVQVDIRKKTLTNAVTTGQYAYHR